MNALTISYLFSNLQFYQAQYLSILQNAEQYFTPVEDAYIHVWPAARQPLYLGDLLQLWLGDKWIVNTKKTPLINTVLRDKNKPVTEFDSYVYKLEGNLFTGRYAAQAWSIQASQCETLNVGSLFQFYCIFKSLNRPKPQAKPLQQPV
jgi:hypothetical protein